MAKNNSYINADLYAQETAAKKAHSNNRTEEGDSQVREDEDAARNSAAEMSSPLHGYREASDMVDANPPTAHMWTSVFDSFSKLSQAIIDKRSTPEAKAKRLQKRADRRARRGSKNNKHGVMVTNKDGSQVYAPHDLSSKFNKRSVNVDNKLKTANTAVEEKNKKQKTFDDWLSKGEWTQAQIDAKKSSLGIT